MDEDLSDVIDVVVDPEVLLDQELHSGAGPEIILPAVGLRPFGEKNPELILLGLREATWAARMGFQIGRVVPFLSQPAQCSRNSEPQSPL